ncbi:reverse transcriptase domain-containing protein [Tanacetum coccineum]
MLAIIHDMIKESVEVFMDDFFVFGNSFDNFLNNLNKMLRRCKDANLILNWEKCHFMVKEGIMLGHRVSSAGLEVDKAKIDILLLQEFDIEIKDKKGIENVTADHLSRIDNDEISDDNDVDDNFPSETLMEITTKDTPWFSDFANYLVDGMIRRCISGPDARTILDQCHHGPTGGHYGPNTTAKKVLDSGFYWPTIIKEART